MKRVPVFIFGAGGVGSALMQQIVDGRSRVAERNDCHFDVVAVADSKSCLWEAGGLSDAQLLKAISLKQDGYPVNDTRRARPTNIEILRQADEAGVKKGIVVDVTAVSGMEPALDTALELGYSLALANKKAFAGEWQTAQKYFNHPHIRHESTVGGGQPVIATLRYLLDTNDPIYTIEGQLSGTLGYICAKLDDGTPFSAAVASAKALGYTEPDPREDLSGMDVMRKVLILGRMAGWPLTQADISVESLYPSNMADMPVDAFMAQASDLDAAMGQRVAAAAAQGQVLRYVAEVSEQGGTVGLKALPATSPLSSLKYVSFCTLRYDDEPLLIGGKGAGVHMTAAGVIGDMLDLVREAG